LTNFHPPCIILTHTERTKMHAIITVGVSASGKSTWAEKHCAAEPYQWHESNRDEIRKIIFSELHGSLPFSWKKWNWKHEGRVTEIQWHQIKSAAENKLNVIVSDTNLNSNRRAEMQAKLERLGYTVTIKTFPVSFDEACRRDAERPCGVGVTVIAKQFEQWNLEFVKQYVADSSLPKAVIVDVDGTLATMHNRSPYEWDKVGNDMPKQFVIDVVNGLKSAMQYKIVVMSGRDGICRDLTCDWLCKYGIEYDDFFIRNQGDMRKDTIVKSELFWENVASRYNVKFVIDDRPSVVLQWRAMGLETMAIGNQHCLF